MTSPQVFRSRLAQVLAILACVVAVVALVSFVSEDGPTALLTTLAPVALVGALAWAVFWNPRVEIGENGITIVNVWRTVHVPWRRFRAADSRWSLSVTTTDSDTYSAWAVPAGSGFGARLLPNRQQTGNWAPAQRKLGSSGTAEAAALLIAEQVETWRGSADRKAQVSTALNVPAIVLVGTLAVLSVLSVALS